MNITPDMGDDFCMDILETAWPKESEFRMLGVDPLSILCIWQAPQDFSYDGRPSDVTMKITRQVAKKIERLGCSRPVIWLSVLTAMLGLLIEAGPTRRWRPSELIPVLFAGERDPILGYKRPLGCYDPLRTIYSLVEVLDTVWCNARGQVSQFQSFKLVNSRILMGRRSAKDKWQNIVAYCGGIL